MNPPIIKFALFGNIYQSEKSANINTIIDFLSERNAEIKVERLFYDFLIGNGKVEDSRICVLEDCGLDADFVISLGGDGTLLRAASFVGNRQIPIVGINTGRLGFLADVVPSEIESALSAIYSGDYNIEKHTVMETITDGKPLEGPRFALNDIAVLKRDTASMITIHTSINGEYLVTYQADGLIVSTPTGSTAYSLSNGGPIIVPQTGSICLTPVAAHSLNIRPIVIPNDAVITLEVESRSHNFLVAVDGQSSKCDESTTVTIRKADYVVNIIKRNNRRYFSTLREKMMWGVDKRASKK